MPIATIRRSVLSVFAALAITLTAVVAASSAAQADETTVGATEVDATVDTGCPSGAVCVYPNDSWNGGQPTYVFWSYGTHKIYNQFGQHRVYNNQTGGAGANLCTESNGTNCGATLRAGYYADVNLTTINTINLFR